MSASTIDILDFSQLGCHWLNPSRRENRPGALEQRPQCQRLLAEFVEWNQVKPFKLRHRNLQALFRQGGADHERVKEVLARYNEGAPFDHGELWGRGRVPLVLIGHPYGIRDDARKTLDALRSIGLVASDYHPSWYGFGTVQIRVYHPATFYPER